MLVLPTTLRHTFWNCTDWNWSHLISEEAKALLQKKQDANIAGELAELAALADQIACNRNWAIKLYAQAWRNRPQHEWIERAIELSGDMGDFSTKAQLLRHYFKRVKTIDVAEELALSYWDSGQLQRATEFLINAAELGSKDGTIADLCRYGQDGDVSRAAKVQRLSERAMSTEEGADKAAMFLLAARLDVATSGTKYVGLLQQAFHTDPHNPRIFTLLENVWIERGDARRLQAMYKKRGAGITTVSAEIGLYRNAGQKLLRQVPCSSDMRVLGIELLTKSLRLVYQNNLELPGLVGTLAFLLKYLVAQGEGPFGVRLLAKALARPRSDDEVIWIVNTGILLAQNDVALERTTRTFMELRSRLLDRHAKVSPIRNSVGVGMHFEELPDFGGDRLQTQELEGIDEELDEMTRPWQDGEGILSLREP